MTMQASVPQLLEADLSRLRPRVAVAVVIVALLLQAYIPSVLSYAHLIDLPLLITIYLALLRRNPVVGLTVGAAIGLAQDSLSNGLVGLYGTTKTAVGYFCSSLTTVVDVNSLPLRVVLVWCFYMVHHVCFWAVERGLLARPAVLVWPRTLLLALANAAVALVIYKLLDRFREST